MYDRESWPGAGGLCCHSALGRRPECEPASSCVYPLPRGGAGRGGAPQPSAMPTLGGVARARYAAVFRSAPPRRRRRSAGGATRRHACPLRLASPAGPACSSPYSSSPKCPPRGASVSASARIDSGLRGGRPCRTLGRACEPSPAQPNPVPSSYVPTRAEMAAGQVLCRCRQGRSRA